MNDREQATELFAELATLNRLCPEMRFGQLIVNLAIEHTQLTLRFSGRDMRLTDVHGHVVKEVLA